MDHNLNQETIVSIKEIGNLPGRSGFVRELFDLFSQQSEQTTKNLLAAVGERDIKLVKYLAHRLKGSSAMIGATQLSLEAESIENLVEDPSCNIEALTLSAQSLQKIRSRTLQELERELFSTPRERHLEMS